MTCFLQLSGCGAERMTEVTPTVMSALKAVENAVDISKVTEAGAHACEYAAACSALYDFVCSEGSRDKMTVTDVGKADVNADYTHRIKAAAELKREALERIAYLMPDEGFLFETM